MYDSLMNRYYKNLLTGLSETGKKSLQKTQRAWLAFRDNESQLIHTLSQEAYPDPEVETLTEASLYLDLVKSRVIQLFTQCDHMEEGANAE